MSDASESSIFLSYGGVSGEIVLSESYVAPGPGSEWIQLTGCSLEAAINLQGRAKGGTTAKVDFGGDAPPISILKKTDSATVGLMREFLGTKPGMHDAAIVFTRTADDGPAEYLRYDLKKCNIMEFEFLSAGDRRSDESFKIVYQQLIITSYDGTAGRKGAQSAAVIRNGG
jgi:type VI protein secretion system component Hcp